MRDSVLNITFHPEGGRNNLKVIVAQFGVLDICLPRLTHHFPAEVVDPAVEVGGDAQLRRHVLRHHRAGRGQPRAGTVPEAKRWNNQSNFQEIVTIFVVV